MNQNWQVGDVALCIKQGSWRDRDTGEIVEIGPKAGQFLTVIQVARSCAPANRGHLLLGFKGHGRDLFAASRFVKIEPEKSEDENAEEATSFQRQQAERIIIEAQP